MAVVLPSSYQSMIHMSRYSRYVDELGRRETWEETVNRYIEFFQKQTDNNKDIPWEELRLGILNLEAMPSMRCLMTAGPALERDNIAAFNCSYLPIDNQRAFDELMFILMNGTGVGFSVESQYISKLPEVPDELHDTETTIHFHDSKLGWAKGFREFLSLLWSGQIPKWDVSALRPAGSRLRTFGGRASGPDPLVDLLYFCINTFKKATGRKLTALECHDIVCKIGDIVVVGGVRRSALISLSDLNDDHLRMAKSGEWWKENGQRKLANNSAVYESRPDMGIFFNEWHSLYNSRSGERGMFSRSASVLQVKKNGRREWEGWQFGTNPCSEIILRPDQFCNLTEAVARADDTKESLKRKLRLATILGTLQATLTNFRYLNKKWKKNTEEERLLGVSITGICDNMLLNTPGTQLAALLDDLREYVVEVNVEFAKILGITPSTAATCVKPSGTLSQLVDSASGIHERYAPYYIRRVRMDKKDPLAAHMIAQGVPCEEDVMTKSNWVFSFPIKAPEGSRVVADVNAIKQLELWKVYQDHWCEHKPSVTVYVQEDEWFEVGAWVYKNFDNISGVSFLPADNGSYRQAPYEEITVDKYMELVAALPTNIDWANFNEETDNTISSQTLACQAGVCDI